MNRAVKQLCRITNKEVRKEGQAEKRPYHRTRNRTSPELKDEILSRLQEKFIDIKTISSELGVNEQLIIKILKNPGGKPIHLLGEKRYLVEQYFNGALTKNEIMEKYNVSVE